MVDEVEIPILNKDEVQLTTMDKVKFGLEVGFGILMFGVIVGSAVVLFLY
jgi:hypothetical protein